MPVRTTHIAGCATMEGTSFAVTAAPESSTCSVPVLVFHLWVISLYCPPPPTPTHTHTQGCPRSQRERKSGSALSARYVPTVSSAVLYVYILSLQNIDRRTKRSRPPNLKDLLMLAVRRMMFPGVSFVSAVSNLPSHVCRLMSAVSCLPSHVCRLMSAVSCLPSHVCRLMSAVSCLPSHVCRLLQTEIFQKPVPADIMKHYREYIFFPMYLDKIKEVYTCMPRAAEPQ